MKKLLLLFVLSLALVLNSFASPLEDFNNEDDKVIDVEKTFGMAPIVLVVLINPTDIYNQNENSTIEEGEDLNRYGEVGETREFKRYFVSYAY